MNVSRSIKCQPYAKSATERNLSANANSMNPSTTFTVFIQPPDLGIDLSQLGNMAKRVKGRAKAMAKPSIPMVGANQPPLPVATSTKRKPMMGPVQEKLTSVRVNAMRKMPSKPPVFSALESTALLHEDGSVSSNAPKNEAANTTNRRKKKILNTAFVAKELSALAPNRAVTNKPRAT